MSTKTKIIVLVVLVVLASLVYYFFFNKPADQTNESQAGGDIKQPATGGSVTVQNDNFPLSQGMQGNNVKHLQMALNFIKPSNPLKVDGIFGSQTAGKLYTTVNAYLSNLPMSEANFNQIIALGNRAQGA